MTKEKEYFIRLMSSFLNDTTPEFEPDINWGEIYDLGLNHSLCGAAAKSILAMPKNTQKQIDNISDFRQQLGYTVMEYNSREGLKSQIVGTLTSNKIPFLFVKGAAIRPLYPAPELRTSGDIDVIVKTADLDTVKSLFPSSQYERVASNHLEHVIKIDGSMVEFHSDNDFDNEYFKSIFDLAEKTGDFQYELPTDEQIMYVLCHIAKHLNNQGAGIRMFMDIDVLLRHLPDFDYDLFLEKAKSAHLESFAKAAFSICNYWFNTPVKAEIDFKNDTDFLELFQTTVIDGGCFGFDNRGIGDFYVDKSMSKSAKNNIFVKIKALLMFIFPRPSAFKGGYPYCAKHPILVPIAWFHRLFQGLFLRGRHSAGTVKQIVNSGEHSEYYRQLMNELDI